MSTLYRPFLLVSGTLSLAAPRLLAQALDLRARATLYGDNTEFFTPFREGETIFGGQLGAWLEARYGDHASLLVGVFGDRRWGSESFTDDVKPILSFRWATETGEGVLGALRTDRRHGLMDALEVSTLESTRPIEYGLQWRERRRFWSGEIFIDWTALNTPEQREAFNYGLLLSVHPHRVVSFDAQLHGLHRGGQLFDAGVPVTNNVASALGVRVHDTLGVLGLTEASVYRLRSRGNLLPDPPAGRPDRGRGTLFRGSVTPGGWAEVFALYWMGKDFLAQDGDPNYGSVGVDPDFYRARRRYFELGAVRRVTVEGGVEVDAEFRLHRIDDEYSKALFESKWEYSYRLIVRAPISIRVR